MPIPRGARRNKRPKQVLPDFFGVTGANMGGELLVALLLEIALHFIERFARGRTGRLESPATFRATKTAKTLLLNPYHLPAHGPAVAFVVGVPVACSIMLLQFSKFASGFLLTDPGSMVIPPRMGAVYLRQSERSVGHPTQIEDSRF
jgi:hypothetical protein